MDKARFESDHALEICKPGTTASATEATATNTRYYSFAEEQYRILLGVVYMEYIEMTLYVCIGAVQIAPWATCTFNWRQVFEVWSRRATVATTDSVDAFR